MTPARNPTNPRSLVRKAEVGDVERICAIERSSFSQPWSRAEFAALLDAARVSFVVLPGGADEVLGYAIVYHAGEAADLANIAIAPEARGRGLGRRLLMAAIEDARVRGVQELFLEVRESNHVARQLYESAGFAAVARRRRYYEQPVEDALVLRRQLGATPARVSAVGPNRHRGHA